MAAIRELFSDGKNRTREDAIAELTRTLGYQRAGSRIQEVLDNDLRTAVRRGILESRSGGKLRLLVRNIDEYSRDHLVEMLLSDLRGWWDRDDLITATARYLGYRRTGSIIRNTLKSIINGAIRRGLLEYDGSLVRRAH